MNKTAKIGTKVIVVHDEITGVITSTKKSDPTLRFDYVVEFTWPGEAIPTTWGYDAHELEVIA